MVPLGRITFRCSEEGGAYGAIGVLLRGTENLYCLCANVRSQDKEGRWEAVSRTQLLCDLHLRLSASEL